MKNYEKDGGNPMETMDKILVIDDSPVQTEFLSSILRSDYDITACHTAEAGLRAAKEGSFSLILLDVVMPEMDGFTLLKEPRRIPRPRQSPHRARRPVVWGGIS